MPIRQPANAVAISQRRSEEHTSELQSRSDLVCRLLLEKKKKIRQNESFTVESIQFRWHVAPVHGRRTILHTWWPIGLRYGRRYDDERCPWRRPRTGRA